MYLSAFSLLIQMMLTGRKKKLVVEANKTTTADGAIDEDTTQAMVDYALAHGVNYFDTAWAYMQNLSERCV